MQARILFLTDLHKRDTDFTTIVGYTKAIDKVQEDILAFIQRNNVTHVVIGGDWYDKGYRNINRTFNDFNYDKALSEAVNGNVFLCRGNHLYIERDSNPEMYIIQPCEAMPLVHGIRTDGKPIFQSPDSIQIGPIQISLFHFSKDNKQYVCERNSETQFHIGVYHDDCMLPSSVRQASGDHGTTSSKQLDYYFKNIDLAICNHIHTAVGQLKVPSNGRDIPMFIPGSLCITKNQPSEIHSEVKLPVVTLDDENVIHVALGTFSLHLDMLKLYKKTETKALDNDQTGAVLKKEVKEIMASKPAASLKEVLINKGYSATDLQIIDEASMGILDTTRAMILAGGNVPL